MTRNTKINGYTELDILMFQAGAPTRFDSPYWTRRDVDWNELRQMFFTPITKLLRKLMQMIVGASHATPRTV